MNLPKDADGDAIRRVVADGSDLSRPMVVDFMVEVPDPTGGERIAQAATELGYRTDVAQDQEEGGWTVYCTKEMLLTYDAVLSAQEELGRLSEPYGGSCDGWGTFGNAGNEDSSGV